MSLMLRHRSGATTTERERETERVTSTTDTTIHKQTYTACRDTVCDSCFVAAAAASLQLGAVAAAAALVVLSFVDYNNSNTIKQA
eukprot:2064-Heterococcus_DN1.PRE.1